MIEDMGEQASEAIPLPPVSGDTWQRLTPLLSHVADQRVEALGDLLPQYRLEQLAQLLTAIDYLDIEALSNTVACEIAKRLNTTEARHGFLTDHTFLHRTGLDSVCLGDSSTGCLGLPVHLSQIVARKLLCLCPKVRASLLKNANIPCLRTLCEHSNSVTSVCISGNRIVSGASDNTIRVRNIETGTCLGTLSGHGDPVRSVYVSENRIVSGAWDGTIRVWDLETGIFLRTLCGHSNEVNSVDVSENRIVSVASDGTIRVRNIETGTCLGTLSGPENPVRSFYVSGNRIVSGSVDRTIRVWNLETGTCIRTLSGHSDVVSSVYVSGNSIVSGSYDHTIRVWNLETGTCIRTLSGHTGVVS